MGVVPQIARSLESLSPGGDEFGSVWGELRAGDIWLLGSQDLAVPAGVVGRARDDVRPDIDRRPGSNPMHSVGPTRSSAIPEPGPRRSPQMFLATPRSGLSSRSGTSEISDAGRTV